MILDLNRMPGPDEAGLQAGWRRSHVSRLIGVVIAIAVVVAVVVLAVTVWS